MHQGAHAADAIAAVLRLRPDSLETAAQVEVVHHFARSRMAAAPAAGRRAE